MEILKVNIPPLKRSEAVRRLDEKQIIFTPNPEILLEAKRNPAFRKVLKLGTLMLPDGHGLLFVSTLLRIRSKLWRAILYFPTLILFLFWKKPFKRIFPEIIHGSDFMEDVVRWSAENAKSVFFLGGQGDVAQKTAEFLLQSYPKLIVAGHSNSDPGLEAFHIVKKSNVEVLFVAYGAPKQEFWISKYASQLPHLHLVMAVGGSFDFFAFCKKRAPLWLRQLGLEWVWRLLLEPQKRIKRILAAFVKFPLISLFFS